MPTYPRHPEFAKGVAAAQRIFDQMFADSGWDGQCSMGFAATFTQETYELVNPMVPLPTEPDQDV